MFFDGVADEIQQCLMVLFPQTIFLRLPGFIVPQLQTRTKIKWNAPLLLIKLAQILNNISEVTVY